ncbi:MAG: GPW/gp25 family protein [Acidimicrobiales bacterium]
MTPRRWTAVRFADPALVGVSGPGGLTLSPTGALDTVSGDDVIRQAILMLLGTPMGERVMRPTYGSLLHRLVFAPNDDTTAGLAIHYVRQALDRWERRIEVLDIDAGSDPDGADRLIVFLRYRVLATQATATIEVPVDLEPDSRAAPGTGPGAAPDTDPRTAPDPDTATDLGEDDSE